VLTFLAVVSLPLPSSHGVLSKIQPQKNNFRLGVNLSDATAVERGICPIAKSTVTVPIKISVIRPLNKGYVAYFSLCMPRYSHISTSDLKSDLTIVFLDPLFCKTWKFRRYAYIYGRYRIINICMDFQDLLAKMAAFGGKMQEGVVQC